MLKRKQSIETGDQNTDVAALQSALQMNAVAAMTGDGKIQIFVEIPVWCCVFDGHLTLIKCYAKL